MRTNWAISLIQGLLEPSFDQRKCLALEIVGRMLIVLLSRHSPVFRKMNRIFEALPDLSSSSPTSVREPLSDSGVSACCQKSRSVISPWKPQLARWLQTLLLFFALAVGLPARALAWDAARMLAAAEQMSSATKLAVVRLQTMLTKAATLETRAKLSLVNDYFNEHVSFAEDMEVWGQIDYWASPLQTLEKGRGDCEDYAIGKYFSLSAAGVPIEQLRLVYVRAQMLHRSQAHMVLAFYENPQSEPLILDSLVTEIRPASQRQDLSPVYSFNGEGLWRGVGTQSTGNSLASLSNWRDILARVRAEGFM